MSMRRVNKFRTLCEVLREINDLHQDTSIPTEDHNKNVRHLLAECEVMAKKMAHKLYEYNKEYDKEWWLRNPDYEKDLLERLSKTYITETVQDVIDDTI